MATTTSTVVKAPAASFNTSGWLIGAPFDLVFLVGIAGVAIGSGLVVATYPHLWLQVLFLDLWLLGYPHVIATFTRLSFDRASFRQNWFLVLVVPPLVALGTIAMAWFVGAWALATTYLYWQWLHYTRQSYGIARVYMRKHGEMPLLDQRVNAAALYLVALFGILYRSAQQPSIFLSTRVKCLPVPEYVAIAVGVLAVLAVTWWALLMRRRWAAGKLPTGLVLHMLSHFAVFYIGYYGIENLTFGWLVLNIWHNAQYLMFVWWFNNRRFKKGLDSNAPLLSFLSQLRPLNILAYIAVSFGLTIAVYVPILHILSLDFFAAIPIATVIVYQTINFHHYIVDTVIWRRKKAKRPAVSMQG